MTELAHRYAPVWHQDVLVAVKKKPKPYVDLLMAESAVINAAIDLGTERSIEAANRFAQDGPSESAEGVRDGFAEPGSGALEEATRALSQSRRAAATTSATLGRSRTVTCCAAGSPDARIAGEEDGDHGRAHGGGQMRDAGVVADVDARRRDPAGQLV